MPIQYSIPKHLQGRKVYTRPCEWNPSGVFVLDENLTPKDLRYLAEIVGIPLEKQEQKVITKEQKVIKDVEPNVQTKANISDSDEV